MRNRWVSIALVLVLSLAAVCVETVVMAVVGQLRFTNSTNIANLSWPRDVGESWPAVAHVQSMAREALIDGDQYSARRGSQIVSFGDKDLKFPVSTYQLTVFRVGWPLRCGAYEHTRETQWIADSPRSSSNQPPTSAWSRGLEIPDWLRGLPPSSSSTESFRRIPLNPIWPGLIANTLLHVLVFTALLVLPGRLIRARRRVKDACLACGYPLAGIAPGSACPECGTAR